MIPEFSQLNEVTAIFAGFALSAAAGLRVFVPLLVLALAAQGGYVDLPEDFSWLTHTPVLIVLGTATAVEIGSYYLPWVDNLLDSIATPAAVASGTVIAAALLPQMNDALQWGLGLLIGGGSAGVVQTATVLTRGVSTATSGGLTNPLVSTAESGGSIAVASLAFLIPIGIGVLVVFLVVWILFRLVRIFRRKRKGKGVENARADSIDSNDSPHP